MARNNLHGYGYSNTIVVRNWCSFSPQVFMQPTQQTHVQTFNFKKQKAKSKATTERETIGFLNLPRQAADGHQNEGHSSTPVDGMHIASIGILD
jgi:hypothetical protein